MIANNILFWVFVGACTAVVYLISQQWSVNHLNPHNVRGGMRLIIGGTILRWLFVSMALVISISHSYQALWSVFIAFITVRFLFLLKWQGWLRIKNPFIRQS